MRWLLCYTIKESIKDIINPCVLVLCQFSPLCRKLRLGYSSTRNCFLYHFPLLFSFSIFSFSISSFHLNFPPLWNFKEKKISYSHCTLSFFVLACLGSLTQKWVVFLWKFGFSVGLWMCWWCKLEIYVLVDIFKEMSDEAGCGLDFGVMSDDLKS